MKKTPLDAISDLISKNSHIASAYVAGALTDVPMGQFEIVLEFYQNILETCLKHNIRAFTPFEMTASHPLYKKTEKKFGKTHPKTTAVVNKLDKIAIRKADLCIITLLDAAVSNGTGIEQEFSRVVEVPVIMMIQRKYPSRMVMGNQNNYLDIIYFDSYKDGLTKLNQALRIVKKILVPLHI